MEKRYIIFETNRRFGISISKSALLKVSLLVLTVSLCVGVPTVSAEDVVSLEWTSPTTAILRSVYMVNASDGWAVGNDGTIIHWDGTDWSTVTSPTTAHLYSVYEISAYIWAVGDGGTIIRFTGISWSTMPSPTTQPLTSVFMLSLDDGWAVSSVDGLYPAIIHWDGSSWSTVTSPTPRHLSSVFMVSASDGWAVGDYGTIIHWDGTEWSNVTSPTTEPLWSVFMVSADDGWAVGSDGTIIRWTGTEWIPEFPTAILMPLLIGFTLVAVILAKTISKKRRKPFLSSKTQL